MQNHIGQREKPQRPSEKAFSVIMQRLSKWVFNRYECQTSHFFFEPDFPRHEVLKSLMKKNDFVRLDGELHFPIRFAGDIVGVVKAKETQGELGPEKQKELNLLFSMMIEPTLKDVERLELADKMSEHMSFVHSSDNIVRFKKERKQDNRRSIAEIYRPKRIRFDLPAMIESSNLFEGRKLALEIHNESQRYAFVTIDEIDISAFESYDDFREIGHLTIFVPRLEDLTKRQKQFLLNYFNRSFRPQGSPQVIACTSSLNELKEMADDDMIQLIDSLSVALIKMDRPFSEYKKAGLVNVLFDALSSRRGHSPNEPEISH